MTRGCGACGKMGKMREGGRRIVPAGSRFQRSKTAIAGWNVTHG